MNYDEAVEATVSKAEAKREIQKHDWDGDAWETFLEDVGEKEEYLGQEVLDWLGY